MGKSENLPYRYVLSICISIFVLSLASRTMCDRSFVGDDVLLVQAALWRVWVSRSHSYDRLGPYSLSSAGRFFMSLGQTLGRNVSVIYLKTLRQWSKSDSINNSQRCTDGIRL